MDKLRDRTGARMVRSIVRMEVGEEIVGGADLFGVAFAGGLHGLDGFGVGDEGVEGEPSFGDGADQQHAEGVGYGEAGGGEDVGGLVLDLGVDACSYDGIGGHGCNSWRWGPCEKMSYTVAQRSLVPMRNTSLFTPNPALLGSAYGPLLG